MDREKAIKILSRDTSLEAVNELKYYAGFNQDKVIEQIQEAMDMGAEALKMQCWIPCSERLPEETGSYLISGVWGSGKFAVGDCDFSVNDGYFRTAWNFDVLAWMPLPEPYKGGE